MHRILLLVTIIVLSQWQANAQCNPNFTTSVNGPTVTVQAAVQSNTYRHNWSFSGYGYSNTGPNLSHTFLAPGTYTIQHYIFDSLQTCIDSLTQSVIVNFTVTCTASYTNVDSLHNGNYHFTSTSSTNSGSITGYNWILDGNSVGTGSVLNYILPSGSHTLCLYIITSAGCTSSSCQTIIGGAWPNCSGYGFAYQTSWPNTTTINFYASPVAQPGETYYWSFGDNTHSSLANPVHTYPSPGNYSLTVRKTDSLNHCTSLATGIVNVTQSQCVTAQITDITATINPANPLQYIFTASASPVDSLFNHAWTIVKIPDSSFHFTSNISSPTVNFPDTGYYQVCLDATNNIGCSLHYCEWIHINGTDSNINGRTYVTVYPNPAFDQTAFKIWLDKPEKISIRLYNTNGMPVYASEKQGAVGLNTISVPLRNLRSSQYFIEIIHGNSRKRSIVQKL